MKLFDFIYNNFPFLHITIRIEHTDRLALILLRKDLLPYLFVVLFNQAIGCLYDVLGRAIILFELEEFGTFLDLRELQDIFDVRSTEGIDALGIVAYHAHLLVLLRKL